MTRRRTHRFVLAMAVLLAGSGVPPVAAATEDPSSPEMVRITGARYRPLYRQPVREARAGVPDRRVVSQDVPPFDIDRRPVTNAEFLAFVVRHPEWRRSRASRLFTEGSMLRHWAGDLALSDAAPAGSPVVHVSWFAARAYCEATSKRLPTIAEWEVVAAADETRRDATRDPRFLGRLRTSYGRPTPAVLPAAGSGFRNAWGAEDMHGAVWEWTLDFNSALVSGESRADASLERNLYCGAGASYATDFADYAAFMRYAYRSSLQARFTTANLGFRCARDAVSTKR